VRIEFAGIPAYGHVYPMVPLAQACADAGHEVAIATGPPFLDRLPLPTVPGAPADLTIDNTVAEAQRRHPDAHGPDLMYAMFGDVMAERVLGTLLPRWSEDPPDLVVFEWMNLGAAVAAELLDVPAAAFAIGIAPAMMDGLHAAARGFRAADWVTQGQVPVSRPLIADALVDPRPQSLVAAAGITRTHRIPVRTVAYNEAAEVPAFLESSTRDRPAVYLTLGTVSFGAVEVLQRALADLADLDVDVLVAVGPEGDPALLGDGSDRVHVERFVDQARVLPLVDVVVHHGGTGTVLGALAAGRAQLLLPQGADQFVNGDLLVKVGAGRVLLNDAQSPGAIGEAVAALLATDSPERAGAARIQAEIAAAPAPADVVADLERLAAR
jgi:UDP:flavonoid glycosyltransferase YjiC (YdhE family)